MSNLSFAKSLRLLKAAEYKAVFNNAPHKASHKHLLLLAKPNQLTTARLGLVIAKKHIRLAVQRNRVKRLIRETFRHQQHELEGLDIIVLARQGLDTLDNKKIASELDKQWSRLVRKQQAHIIKSEQV